MRTALLAALLGFQCFAAGLAAADGPSAEAAREIVREETPFPDEKFVRVPIPASGPREKSILAWLVGKGFLRENPYSVPAEHEKILRLQRGYPDYEVKGVELKLCEMDLARAVNLRRRGAGLVLAGTSTVNWTDSFREIHEDAAKLGAGACGGGERKWMIRGKGRKFVVSEER